MLSDWFSAVAKHYTVDAYQRNQRQCMNCALICLVNNRWNSNYLRMNSYITQIYKRHAYNWAYYALYCLDVRDSRRMQWRLCSSCSHNVNPMKGWYEFLFLLAVLSSSEGKVWCERFWILLERIKNTQNLKIFFLCDKSLFSPLSPFPLSENSFKRMMLFHFNLVILQ